MDAQLAIQLEQHFNLMLMVLALFFIKIGMIELKDAFRLRLEQTLRLRRQMVAIRTQAD